MTTITAPQPVHTYRGNRATRSFVRVDRTFRERFSGRDASTLQADALYYFKGVHLFTGDELLDYCQSVQDGREVVGVQG
jgi:hypothetical protein